MTNYYIDDKKWCYIANGMIWLSAALAICICIYFTHRIVPLWFFLMPLRISASTLNNNSEKEINLSEGQKETSNR